MIRLAPPFPEGLIPNTSARENASAQLRRGIDELRDGWLNPPDLVERGAGGDAGLSRRLHRKTARLAATLRYAVTLFRLRLPLATAAQLRNGRLEQDEVPARLARVKPDDRTTPRAECETFRLAI
jgi:hypothetical protein